MPINTHSDMLTYLSLITLYVVMHKLMLSILNMNASLPFFSDIIN